MQYSVFVLQKSKIAFIIIIIILVVFKIKYINRELELFKIRPRELCIVYDV